MSDRWGAPDRDTCAGVGAGIEGTPWLGFILGALRALFWGVQAIISRQSVADGLTAGDVAVLRFATAGLLLLPVALHFGRSHHACRTVRTSRILEGWQRTERDVGRLVYDSLEAASVFPRAAASAFSKRCSGDPTP